MIIENKNVEPSECPACFYRFDSASCASKEKEGTQPSFGDWTVCVHCGAVLKFIERHQLEVLSEEELTEAMTDPIVARIVELIKSKV